MQLPGNNLYTCEESFDVSSEGPSSRVTTIAGIGNFRGRAFARNVEILLNILICLVNPSCSSVLVCPTLLFCYA
jgi:hypothetical protein